MTKEYQIRKYVNWFTDKLNYDKIFFSSFLIFVLRRKTKKEKMVSINSCFDNTDHKIFVLRHTKRNCQIKAYDKFSLRPR